jgi:hypothetical protein
LQADRRAEAVEWFMKAAEADPDEETDAGERLTELAGDQALIRIGHRTGNVDDDDGAVIRFDEDDLDTDNVPDTDTDNVPDTDTDTDTDNVPDTDNDLDTEDDPNAEDVIGTTDDPADQPTAPPPAPSGSLFSHDEGGR